MPSNDQQDLVMEPTTTTVAKEGSETSTTKKRPAESSEEQQQQQASNEKPGVGNNPITQDGVKPQKKFYRQRAHCNPLSHNDSFAYPIKPSLMDWTIDHYPNLPPGTVPTVLDIGCGFGGLTMALGPLLQGQTQEEESAGAATQEVILGMEIRAKVTEYVRLRIAAGRKEYLDAATAARTSLGHYQNCSVLRTNSMKFLPNFFGPASLTKLYFCFPDPHFKRKNHPRRIVSERLLSEYAYCLKPTIGRLYCITDVKELHEWHVQHCDAHPLFQRITDNALLDQDPCVKAMIEETEEGKKVARAGGEKYYAVYQRIPDHQGPTIDACNFFRSD